MANAPDGPGSNAAPASSPCLAENLDASGRPQIDPEQRRDVARWRRVERERLIALRMALPADHRLAMTRQIEAQLEARIAAVARPIVSAYWPIRAEPDLRPWIQRMHQAGVEIALPVVVAPATQLEFRRWTPGCAMEHGVWQIPQPAERHLLTPNVTIAPLVGFDPACYRLGYGGGFFDRTLAQLHGQALALGVGYPSLALPTIFPQPFDIPMDWILAGDRDPVARPKHGLGIVAPEST
jgi:5,10-methenyltetrahydrofolate synthetase